MHLNFLANTTTEIPIFSRLQAQVSLLVPVISSSLSLPSDKTSHRPHPDFLLQRTSSALLLPAVFLACRQYSPERHPYPCRMITSASTMMPAIRTSETLTGERSPLFQSENRLLLSSSMLHRPFRFQIIK